MGNKVGCPSGSDAGISVNWADSGCYFGLGIKAQNLNNHLLWLTVHADHMSLRDADDNWKVIWSLNTK